MRTAQFVDKKGKCMNEHIIIFDSSEGKALIEALEDYCERNKRKKKIKSILDQLEKTLCVYG